MKKMVITMLMVVGLMGFSAVAAGSLSAPQTSEMCGYWKASPQSFNR